LHPDVYDDLDTHLARAPDFGQACVPMGMLLTWCANMNLLSARVLQEHEALIMRIRFEDALGSELLVVCGGALRRDMFNDQGQAFLNSFYPDYLHVYTDTFGEDMYAVKENWPNYERLAQTLTRKYLGAPGNRQKQPRGRLLAKLSSWLKS
jgi:hypothetical protein